MILILIVVPLLLPEKSTLFVRRGNHLVLQGVRNVVGILLDLLRLLGSKVLIIISMFRWIIFS